MSAMDTYVGMLQTYSHRDKILRIVSYGSAFASGAFRGHLGKVLTIISQRISAARTVNRLFDDIPFWTITRTLGSSDRDIISRLLTAVANIIMQCYFPIEKLSWASANEIIPLDSQPYSRATIAIWGIYMVLNVLRSIRELIVAKNRIIKVLKQRKLESPEKSDEKEAEFRRKLDEQRGVQKKELLMIVKNLADLVMVINWLPLGILWSGKLSVSRNAFFGTISSVIALYMAVVQYKATTKKKKF